MGRSIVVGIDETAEIVLPFEVFNLVLRLHGSKVIGIEVIYGQAEIAVAKSHTLEPDGVVVEVEVGALILARVEYLHTVVSQMLITKNGAKEIIGRFRQFNLILLTQQLIESLSAGHLHLYI